MYGRYMVCGPLAAPKRVRGLRVRAPFIPVKWVRTGLLPVCKAELPIAGSPLRPFNGQRVVNASVRVRAYPGSKDYRVCGPKVGRYLG